MLPGGGASLLPVVRLPLQAMAMTALMAMLPGTALRAFLNLLALATRPLLVLVAALRAVLDPALVARVGSTSS